MPRKKIDIAGQLTISLFEAAVLLGVKPKRAFELARRHKAFDVKKGSDGRLYLADLDAFAEYADRRAKHLVALDEPKPQRTTGNEVRSKPERPPRRWPFLSSLTPIKTYVMARRLKLH
jgi:hypothetical protein